MDWFKRHKDYPDFYLEYLESFKMPKQFLENTRFIVFDTETTGLNPKTDRILSIGNIGVKNFQIDVADSFECYIEQTHFNKDTVEIHGILKAGHILKIDEKEAIIQFLRHVKNSVLVAHHAAFDIAMINAALHRLELPRLKNKVVDTGALYKKTKYIKADKPYGLDDLCEKFGIVKHDRHTAAGDAFLTALLFLKLISVLRKKKGRLKLRNLIGWY